MPITQQYTAVAGDVITAARWNNEFGNIYNNLAPSLNTYGIKNVRDDYDAVGDGVTNDQSALVTAVAAAYAEGFQLYWPVGSYKTTATISNFHDVKHCGPGTLVRGSDVFYIEPFTSSHANDIYVSTAGVDTNDGLSASEPVLTVQHAMDILGAWAPLQYGWTVWLAAGTYAEAVSLRSHTSFNDNYLTIRGPAPTTAGTASGATITKTTYAVGASAVTLNSAGTGTILVGDIIQFSNHNLRYTVTSGDDNVANGGTISFSPTLVLQLDATGTATGATTDATGYALATTTITLASAGAGTIIAGDTITFAGDTTRYKVTTGDADVSNGGTLIFTPGLAVAIAASTTAITVEAITVNLLGTTQIPPTAIIDYPGSGSIGLDLNWNNKVKVQDIKFTDWMGSAVTGVNADQGCILWCYNVHASYCRQGIVGNECQLYVQGGILHGVDWTTGAFPGSGGSVGVVAYAGTLLAIGYGGTTERTGTIIENFSQAGYEAKAHTHCVSTWCTFQSNEKAVWLYTDSRYDDRHNLYKKNELVYLLNRGYVTRDDVLGFSDYHMGETYSQTPGALGMGNFQIYTFYQYSADESFAHIEATGGLDICHQRVTSSTQTGTIGTTFTRTLATIAAGSMIIDTGTNGKYLEIFLCGATTGATGTKTITLLYGTSTITTLTIATGTVTWTAHITLWTVNSTAFVQVTEASNATIAAVRASIGSLNLWTDKDLEVWTAIPGAADTAILHEARVVRWG